MHSFSWVTLSPTTKLILAINLFLGIFNSNPSFSLCVSQTVPRKFAIHISLTEINATVMQIERRNRAQSKPANRRLYRCTTFSQHNALHSAPKARLRPPLSSRSPLFAATDGNSRSDWILRNARDFTFHPLWISKDARICTSARHELNSCHRQHKTARYRYAY